MEKKITTLSGKFYIRPFRKQDESGVLDLWSQAFGQEMPEKLWRWKYFDNPFGQQILLCLTEDLQPVTMFAAIPYSGLWQGKEVMISHAMDNMSHPSFRGLISGKRGLFVKTVESFLDSYLGGQSGKSIFLYGFPGYRHFRLGQIYLGYDKLYNNVKYLKIELSRKNNNYRLFKGKIEPVEKVDERFDDLNRRYYSFYPLSVKRDASFLHWRFLEHPINDYEIWIARSFLFQKVLGYAVLKTEGNKCKIIDFYMMPDKIRVANFINQLINELAMNGLEEVETWLPEKHFLTEILQSLGFASAAEPLGIVPSAVSRAFHPDLSFRWASENLFYTMADGDLF